MVFILLSCSKDEKAQHTKTYVSIFQTRQIPQITAYHNKQLVDIKANTYIPLNTRKRSPYH